jgi:hypothetical protein
MDWIKSWWKKLKEPRAIQLAEALQNFTPRAQRVIELAQKHAMRLGHSFIGTEHVLLGLSELGQGIACTVLLRFGVQYETVRREMERLIPVGDRSLSMRSPIPTPRVEKVFGWAKKEAEALRHHYVGTEHLLLGLLSEPDGVAAIVLKGFNVDFKRARREIVHELDTNSVSSDAIIESAEVGMAYLEAHPPPGASFHLPISDSFTFTGKPDTMGAGMAILADKILGLGYMPDGFEQKNGFRLYAYKKFQ